MNIKCSLILALAFLAFSPTSQANKLTSTKAEVSFYNDEGKLVSGSFEYYVKRSNVQYGQRFGVDLYKVAFLFWKSLQWVCAKNK